MNKITEQKIYETVSSYYDNKKLSPSEFSNRLYAIKCVVIYGNSIGEAISFLNTREHWWEYEAADRRRNKNRARYQIKAILEKLKFN